MAARAFARRIRSPRRDRPCDNPAVHHGAQRQDSRLRQAVRHNVSKTGGQECRLPSATCVSTSWIPSLPSTTPPAPPSCRSTRPGSAVSTTTPNISASPSATAHWPGSWSASVPTRAHDSDNFRWFRERHPRFFYIDRIVDREPPSRRRRRPRVLRRRAELCRGALSRNWPAKCSWSSDSDPALLFHGSFGFREVGQHVMPTGSGPAGARRC